MENTKRQAVFARMERFHPAREAASTPLAIPRVIHQTFETMDIPRRMHDAAMNWVATNPTWEYRYSDDAARRALIAKHFGPEVMAAYNKLEHGAFRADLWRYCVLYLDGGAYVDIDTAPGAPLDTVLEERDEFVSGKGGFRKHAVACGFICARAGHPFLKRAIERATEEVLTFRKWTFLPGPRYRFFDGFMATGPGNLGAAINLTLGKDEQAPIEAGRHDAEAYPFRLLSKVKGEPGYFVAGDTVVFWMKYDRRGYHDDLAEAGVKHWNVSKHSRSRFSMQKRRVRKLLKRLR